MRGEFAPGDLLPPERALAEQFQLTRLTVRAALARVAAAGLVSARQGSGYRVHDFRRRGGPDLLSGLAAVAGGEGQLAALVDDLLLVRRQLARAVLERLAGGVAPERRADLDTAVARFETAAGGGAGPDDLAAADLEVIAALLAATDSPVLALCSNPIARALADLPALSAAIYAEPAGNLAGYRALSAWLDDPRPDRIPDLIGLLEERDRVTVASLRAAEASR